MMLLEKEIEDTLVEELKTLEGLGNYQFVTSRFVAEADETLEEDQDTDGVICVASGFRSHDNYSIPLISIPFTITIATRVEKDRNGAKHESTIHSISRYLSKMHSEIEDVDVFNSSQFFAGALNITSGSGRTYDKANGIWSESISISIRGSERID